MLITALSHNTGCSPDVTSKYADTIVKWLIRQIMEEGKLFVSDFGEFCIQKRMEFVYHDTATKKRWLIPPSLQLLFTPMPLIDKEKRENSKAFARIAEAIAQEHGENQLTAHKFAVMFFKTILDAMEEASSVEVEGLGVFELTQMKVADAIYGKVTFTADSVFLADINKPFSFFQPVEINEGVSFPDIETSTHRFPEEKNNKTFLIFQEKQEPEENAAPSEAPAEPFSASVGSADAEEKAAPTEAPAAPFSAGVGSADAEENAAPTEAPAAPFSASVGSADAEENAPSVEPAPAFRRSLRYLLPALLLAGCILLFLLLKPAQADQPPSSPDTTTASKSTTDNSSAALEEPPSEVPTTPLPASSEDQAGTLDFAAMNAQLPYGGYDIVGVASTITVPSGMTLQKIARTYLGTDYTEYLVVLNGGNADPQPGQKYMIPKLLLRKQRH